MFYSEAILSKKGPLAKIWLAAHWERKLSKAQFLQTDISSSVGAIMGQDQAPMALRLSGQLLLGVVRIYSRKARYLLEDCNEALLKLKMAFRPGIVDLSDDQMRASSNNITLQDTMTELDMMLPDPFLTLGAPPVILSSNANVSRPQDITLTDKYGHYGYGDEFDPSFIGVEHGRGLDPYTSGLGMDGDGVLPSREPSIDVEVGRDAVRERSLSMGAFGGDVSMRSGRKQSGAFSNADNISFDLGMNAPFNDGGDLGLDLGFGSDDRPNFGSPIAGPSPGNLFSDGFEFDLNFGQADADENRPKATPTARKRKVIVDSVTEIPARQIQQQTKDTSDIITEPAVLPATQGAMLLQRIEKMGVDYFWQSDDSVPHSVPAIFADLYKNTRKRPVQIDLESGRVHKSPRLDRSIAPAEDNLEQSTFLDDAPIIFGDDEPQFGDDTIVMDAMPEAEQLQETGPLQASTLTKNTITTVSLLRREFSKVSDAESPTLSFQALAGPTKAKKDEAAKLFFEMLLLGTKDAITVQQSTPYGDIQIGQKEKLFDLETLPPAITAG